MRKQAEIATIWFHYFSSSITRLPLLNQLFRYNANRLFFFITALCSVHRLFRYTGFFYFCIASLFPFTAFFSFRRSFIKWFLLLLRHSREISAFRCTGFVFQRFLLKQGQKMRVISQPISSHLGVLKMASPGSIIKVVRSA